VSGFNRSACLFVGSKFGAQAYGPQRPADGREGCDDLGDSDRSPEPVTMTRRLFAHSRHTE
jgi:hypothetical protein